MKLVMCFLVVLVLMLEAVPVVAQEVEPVPVNGDDLLVVNQYVIVGVLGVVVALIGLLAGSLALLYRSAPPWAQLGMTTLADVIMKQLDTLVEATPTQADDVLRDALNKLLEEYGLLPPGVVVSASVVDLDAAIYGGDNTKGDGPLGDPVPIGG